MENGFEWLSRAGFVARGLVYGIIGILALKLAFGNGGKNASQQGALKTVAHQPFGHLLLTLVAIGLGGYALWRFVRAALGHGVEDEDDAAGRVVAFASGAVYAALCAIAVEILAGSGGGGTSGGAKKPTAGVLGWPAGQWLVGIVGAVLVGVGLYQTYRGVSRQFLDDSKTEEMSPGVKHAITVAGTIGHLARAVVFTLVGIFLIKAALEYDPHAAVGIDGALAKLQHASYGPVLLGVVAAGLIAFSAYSLADARYHRI